MHKPSHSAHRGRHKSRMEVLSRLLRANHPFCQVCGIKPSTEVHHVVKWTADESARLDPRLLMAVCRSCHEQVEKSARG